MASRAQRLEDKVSPEPNSGCWLWTGSVDRHGYPKAPTETRECENCGKQKPIEEMETVFARGHGETYQCLDCRGGP